jgi:Putative phage tail protein
MGALSGGGTNTKNVIRYSDLQVSTSQLDIPITLFWGQRRISPNCIWYNDFQSHKVNAGKGASKGGEYTYSAAVILGLGEGVMSAPVNVWGPSSTTTTTTLAKLGLGFMPGTATQTPWSYVTTKWPAQALSYMDTAYVYSANMNLGESASVPDYGFELQRLCGFTNTFVAPGWTNPVTGGNTAGTDVSLADVIPDFLTNTIYGMGFASGDIGDLTSFRAYQSAQGLYFSPCLTSQEKATEVLDRWAQFANSWIFWSGTEIEFVPLGDSAISGNGYTYTPDLAAAYALDLADFVVSKGAAPVEMDRQDPADCYNRTVLEICDRARGYISNPVEYKDQQLVAMYGLRDNSSTQADDICNPAVGAVCVQLIGKRAAYIRNTYKFKLSYRFIRLLPGSIVTLTESNIGLDDFPVRIRTVDEDENGVLSFLAEELPAGIGTYFTTNTPPLTTATTTSTEVDPGPVNTPAVCEPASTFAQGKSVALIAASGGVNWGGANVFLSLDGTDYSQIGTLTAPALQGTLLSGLPAYAGTGADTTDTLSVDATQSRGVWPAASVAAAENFSTLAWISPQPVSSGGSDVLSSAGELLAFGAVAATGTYTANLTFLERGLYGTNGIAHATGDQFTLFDATGKLGGTLIYDLPAQYIGRTLYLKFQSFNVFEQAAEDLSTVTTYEFVPSGASFGSAAAGLPSEPQGFGGIVQSSQVLLTWSANPVNDNVAAYAVYRADGASAPFSSAALVWSGDALAFTDTNVDLVTGYTYYVVAINSVGDSLPSTGFDATTAGINNGQVIQSGSFAGGAAALITFNPQVLACKLIEITLFDLYSTTIDQPITMTIVDSSGEVTTGYNWSYVQASGSATPSPGSATNDSAIHLSNIVNTSSTDTALVFVRGTINAGVYPKFASTANATYFTGGVAVTQWTGTSELQSSSEAPTGLMFRMGGFVINGSYAIRGYSN